MIHVEIDFVYACAQPDGADRYFHGTEGWAHGESIDDMKQVVRETTNIQDEIEIVAWRCIPSRQATERQ